jgi:RNA polymerase sigma factor (sigma-70 family)
VNWLQYQFQPVLTPKCQIAAVMSDEEIVKRIKKGDESALDYLYKKNYRVILRYVLSNNGTTDEAKDLFQDALIVFWEKVRSGELVLTSKISTFVFSICKNLWHKELNRKSRLSGASEHEPGESYDHDAEERLNIVLSAISKMGETCKKVLMLYYFDKLSMQDIAIELGFANADTAKTKKYKCKSELEKLIKQEYEYKDFWD